MCLLSLRILALNNQGKVNNKMQDIFKKQYVLSSCELELPNMQRHLIGTAYLYTHSMLKVEKLVTESGRQMIVLGNAYCTDSAPKTIKEDVADWDGDSLVELTQYWTGRWALLTEGELVTDACGLMAAFYKIEENNWIVSSSLAVMAELCHATRNGICSLRGINWQLLPGSRVDGVNKLCSTQKLVFSDKQLSVAPYIWPKDHTSLTTEEKSREMNQMLITACKNIAGNGEKPLMLALTGGKDSRLVLAALLNSGVHFETYTFAYPNLSVADKTLPVKMSRSFGIRHNFIKRRKLDEKKEDEYIRFTFGDSNGMDAVFYAYGQFEQIPKDAVVIRSGIFEAGQSYGRTVAGNTLESFERGIRNYYADDLVDERQNHAFELWLRWTENNPINFIDIRDRFYIEQRVGGWAAAIEQSFDINDFTSIQIANCPKLLSLLLSATEEERKAVAISMQSIEQLQPDLLKYPVNKKTVLDMVYFAFDVMKSPTKRLRNFINRYRRK